MCTNHEYFEPLISLPLVRTISKFVHIFLSQHLTVEKTGTAGDKASFEKIEAGLEILDNILKGQTWVAGNNITIADYSIVVSVSSIEVSLL
jgi:glutathione S-transferase